MRREYLLFAALALPSGRPSIEIKGFHMVESQLQKRSLEMTANTAKIYKADNLGVLETLMALVFGEGQAPYEIRGNRGILNTDTQDFRIIGDSQVLSPNGFIFKTTNISYQAATKMLDGQEAVYGSNEADSKKQSTMQLTGIGLHISMNDNAYEIKERVQATQLISKDNSLTIKAANSVIFPEKKSAIFNRNVLVQSPNLVLNGERLVINFDGQRPQKLTLDSPGNNAPKKIKADMKSMVVESLGLVVEFGPDGNMEQSEAIGQVFAQTADGVKMKAEKLVTNMVNGAQRVVMNGKVEITVDSRVATCEQAQYFPDSGDVLLEKIAAVRKGKEVLEGERIRFSTKHSEIYVEKARGQLNKSGLGISN